MEINQTKVVPVIAKELRIHIKVCDRFSATLHDDAGNVIGDPFVKFSDGSKACDHIGMKFYTRQAAPAGVSELRIVAKRNLRSLIERGSDDTALMLKCLEELS